MNARRVCVWILLILLIESYTVLGLSFYPTIYFNEKYNSNEHKNYKIFWDKIHFQYYEPYIPEKVYKLKVSPDLDLLKYEKNRLLYGYCLTQRYLVNLHNHLQLEELAPPDWKIESYNNGKGKIVLDHYHYSIGFHDVLVSSEYKNPTDYEFCRRTAGDFLETYIGDITDYNVTAQNQGLVEYNKFFEGVKITGPVTSKIYLYVCQSGRIARFLHYAYKYEIIELIPTENILSATEAVECSYDSLIMWYNYSEPVKLSNPSLVYLQVDEKIFVAWEFYYNNYIPLYLDAVKGGVINPKGLSKMSGNEDENK